MGDRAIKQGEAGEKVVVYEDERFTLGEKDGLPYLIADGKKFSLTCHPYEPCLYITDEGGVKTAVHNAFDPFCVLESFHNGETITSITGRKYGARDFCEMVVFAAGRIDIGIDGAEKVFDAEMPREKNKEPVKKKEEKYGNAPFHPEAEHIIYDDPFYGVIGEYPDTALDFCLVKNGRAASGHDAHRYALVLACRELFFDGEEQIWRYDCGGAEGKQIAADALFDAASGLRGTNYRGAFKYPPCGVRYSDKDFDRVNDALFPNGTKELEVYEWTTDWSEYFDDGHEWWGALCYTVYDKKSDRIAVIMASATD